MSLREYDERDAVIEELRGTVNRIAENFRLESADRYMAQLDLEAAKARIAALEAALAPFAALAEKADAFGYESGSTCEWRISYDDLNNARKALDPL